MCLQISDHFFCDGHAVLNLSQGNIATMTKQPSNLPRNVVVVNLQLVLVDIVTRFLMIFAGSTSTALEMQNFVKLL